MPNWLHQPKCVAALLALAVAVMLHGNLTGPFYQFDDHRYVPHSVGGHWTDLLKPKVGILYGPVTFFSIRLDRVLFGPSQEEVLRDFNIKSGDMEGFDAGEGGQAPVDERGAWAWGPRLMNGVYHCIAGFLLWCFFSRLGVGRNIALFIAFVWTAHPSALESVAWVCERKNVMCALWGFSALLVWTADREWRWRWPLVWLLYTVALLAKMSALSFVPVFVALELFDPRRNGRWDGRFWLGLAGKMSGIFILSAGILALTMYVFKGDIALPPGGSVWTGLMTDVDIFGRYALNSLLPFFNSFYYSVEPVISLRDPRLWLYGVATVLSWTGLYFAARPEDRKWILLGWIWFYGALGPNANIIASAFPMQDRYTYLPMPGLLLAFAVGMRGLIERLSAEPLVLRGAALVFCAMILVMCGVRSPVYRNSNLLVFDAAARQPLSGFGMLMAIHILNKSYNAYIPQGEKPDPQKARRTAEVLIQYCTLAEQTPDYWHFTSPGLLRLRRAELLLFLGREKEAVQLVEPMLRRFEEMKDPLDWRKLYPNLPKGFGVRFRAKVDREMMHRAWLANADALLLISLRRDTPKEERIGYAKRAVECARMGVEFNVEDARSLMLVGRTLLRHSDLLAERNEMPEALSLYDQAREVLLREPIKVQGEALLKNLPPPEPPKPQAPPTVPPASAVQTPPVPPAK